MLNAVEPENADSNSSPARSKSDHRGRKSHRRRGRRSAAIADAVRAESRKKLISAIAQVAVGGAIGSVCRYLTGQAAEKLLGTGLPYGTLAANLIGSMLMGAAFVFLSGNFGEAGRFSPLIMTGVLGGYTTFSAYSLEAWQLFDSGRPLAALGYAGGSAALAIASLAVGIALAKAVSA